MLIYRFELLVSGSILEFKGSIQHVQKGHPTLVSTWSTSPDSPKLIKVLVVTIGLNRFAG